MAAVDTLLRERYAPPVWFPNPATSRAERQAVLNRSPRFVDPPHVTRPRFPVRPDTLARAVSKVGPMPSVGTALQEAVTWNA